jgi:hypothetical protein
VAGACTTATAPACPLSGKSATMIDDGSEEGAVAGVLQQCGRSGSWFTFHDPNATQVPNQGQSVPISTAMPPNGVLGYVETTGTLDASGYGVGIGVPLNGGNPYNAAQYGYAGISFWIWSAGAVPTIYFQVPDTNTAATQSMEYYFETSITPPARTWTKYSIAWSDLSQAAGSQPSVDTRGIVVLQWQIKATPGSGAQSFDIAIGDIEFLP